MEAGVLRVVVLVALFLLLTADYSALVSQLLHAFGDSPTPKGPPPPPTPVPSLGDDAWQAMTTTTRKKLVSTIKNTCLPKLICELNAAPLKDRLSDSEKALLSLIRDTSMGITGEVTSKYHFAAHMGQLIAGVDGAGCHNFYPGCPFPGLTAISLVKTYNSIPFKLK